MGNLHGEESGKNGALVIPSRPPSLVTRREWRFRSIQPTSRPRRARGAARAGDPFSTASLHGLMATAEVVLGGLSGSGGRFAFHAQLAVAIGHHAQLRGARDAVARPGGHDHGRIRRNEVAEFPGPLRLHPCAACAGRPARLRRFPSAPRRKRERRAWALHSPRPAERC